MNHTHAIKVNDIERAAAPLELLKQFDGWLENACFGDDHPWRVAIARTRTEHAASVTIDEPSLESIDKLIRRARVCAEAGECFVEQMAGTQLDHSELVELFAIVRDAATDAAAELSSLVAAKARTAALGTQ